MLHPPRGMMLPNKERDRMDQKGVGGFLESILAVMVVITASSVFLVVLSVDAVPENGSPEEDEILAVLERNGLFAPVEAMELDRLRAAYVSFEPSETVSGIHLVYRLAGNQTPLLELGGFPPAEADVLSIQRPFLLLVEGRATPAVMEVSAWA